jgi:mono/diheme cytochrome c family protein
VFSGIQPRAATADNGTIDRLRGVIVMRYPIVLPAVLLIAACASETAYDPLEEYEEVDAVTVIDAPAPTPGRFAPSERDTVARGEYLVELLGCGACHTPGALDGEPDMSLALAGSGTGIAWSNPLGTERPGIVFPSNITPDDETGIGAWSDQQIANAIRAGIGRHGGRRITTMPWQGYARLTDDDVAAIVAYLRTVDPVRREVPQPVAPGEATREPVVYFGVYRRR